MRHFLPNDRPPRISIRDAYMSIDLTRTVESGLEPKKSPTVPQKETGKLSFHHNSFRGSEQLSMTLQALFIKPIRVNFQESLFQLLQGKDIHCELFVQMNAHKKPSHPCPPTSVFCMCRKKLIIVSVNAAKRNCVDARS